MSSTLFPIVLFSLLLGFCSLAAGIYDLHLWRSQGAGFLPKRWGIFSILAGLYILVDVAWALSHLATK